MAESTGGDQPSLRDKRVRALLPQGKQHSAQLRDGVSATSISALLPISLQQFPHLLRRPDGQSVRQKSQTPAKYSRTGKSSSLLLMQDPPGDRRLIVPGGDGPSIVQTSSVTAVHVPSGIRREQLLQWNQVLILAGESPAGRAPLPLLGPGDHAGPDRVESCTASSPKSSGFLNRSLQKWPRRRNLRLNHVA